MEENEDIPENYTIPSSVSKPADKRVTTGEYRNWRKKGKKEEKAENK